MLLMIIVSFFLTGTISFYHFKQENELSRREKLRQKEHAVHQAIDFYLSRRSVGPDADSLIALFDRKICQLSSINSLDVNLYALSGQLLLSSRPSLFEDSILPPRIPFYIMEQLHQTSQRVLHRSQSDSLSFLSSYNFIRNPQEKPIAILQLPYFQAGDPQEQDLREFLMRLGEIYLLLFLAAGVLAYLLSDYITGSLQAITEKIKHTRISEKNPPLQWRFHDEIGTLVDEYNRMVEELEKSAVKLAETERESAWKEMARQVAHEIKNPLTPMRLSVQHLERSLATEQPERLREFCRSMVTQIDSLSSIAEAFSRFASLPEGEKQKTDLTALLKRVRHLYPEEEIHLRAEENLVLWADPGAILRLLNNLINNALQAIPAGTTPKIFLRAYQKNGELFISVQDNGVGIPPEQQKKIFEPRFTTKTRGMGLGLPLVKRIVDSLGGHIQLHSQPGQGTTFELILPVKSPTEAPAQA